MKHRKTFDSEFNRIYRQLQLERAKKQAYLERKARQAKLLKVL